jgi:hypothetical protein
METKEKCCEKGHRCSPWKCIGMGILGVLGFTALMVLIGFAIVWLWNCIMPSLFNLPEITFWQAIGLAILARLIIGASHGGWHRKFHRKWKHTHGHCDCNDSCCSSSHSVNRKNEKCGCSNDAGSNKWAHYDKFWEEEGEKYFNDYVSRKENNQ